MKNESNKVNVDMHIHIPNTRNDEEFLKAEQWLLRSIETAKERELAAVSFVGRNDITPYLDGGLVHKLVKQEKIPCGLKLISGTEMMCNISDAAAQGTHYSGKMSHILLYGFDPDKAVNVPILNPDELKRKREKDANNIQSICHNNGLFVPNIDPEKDLIAQVATYIENNKGTNRICSDLLVECADKYPTLKTALCRLFFENPESKEFFYMREAFPTVKKCLEQGECGKRVLAHPFYMEKAFTGIAYADQVREIGSIDGLECDYRSNTCEEIERSREYANKHDLLITAGSDFHDKVAVPYDPAKDRLAPQIGLNSETGRQLVMDESTVNNLPDYRDFKCQ